MKNNKVQSLPPDLKAEASKLISKKFPEPKKDASFYGATVKFAESMEKLKDAVGIPVEVGEMHIGMDVAHGDDMTVFGWQRPHQPIDERILDFLEHCQQMSPDYEVRIHIEFKPVGKFKKLTSSMYNRFRSEEMEICFSVEEVPNVYSRIQHRLLELNKYYGGSFFAQMKRHDVRVVDQANWRYRI